MKVKNNKVNVFSGPLFCSRMQVVSFMQLSSLCLLDSEKCSKIQDKCCSFTTFGLKMFKGMLLM